MEFINRYIGILQILIWIGVIIPTGRIGGIHIYYHCPVAIDSYCLGIWVACFILCISEISGICVICSV